MSDFTVTVPVVERTSVATRGAGAQLHDELVRLRREVDTVLTEQWRGAAASAFDRAWAQWHEGACEVVAALDRLAELLADAGRAYGWSDTTGAERLHLASSGLPG